MSGQILTPAGPIHLGDVDDQTRWIAGGEAHPTTVLGTMTVLTTPLLPIEPSPGEVARRIVRHGFHDAGLLPEVEGDVGPKPGDRIRALQIHGQLYVDAELAEQLKTEAAVARDRAWAEGRRRAAARVDLVVIATMIGVPRVEALREPEYFRTLYRAHLAPVAELEPHTWIGGPQVRIEDDELHRANLDPWKRRAYIAGKLRDAVVAWKVDEEEAGRGR